MKSNPSNRVLKNSNSWSRRLRMFSLPMGHKSWGEDVTAARVLLKNLSGRVLIRLARDLNGLAPTL
jgi:hypothetical protein